MAASILIGSGIGVIGGMIDNAVNDHYFPAEKEEGWRRLSHSNYGATNWSMKIAIVAVPLVTLLAWWWMRREPGRNALSRAHREGPAN